MRFYAMFENGDGTISVARYDSKKARDKAVEDYPVWLGAGPGAGQLTAWPMTRKQYLREVQTASEHPDNYQPNEVEEYA